MKKSTIIILCACLAFAACSGKKNLDGSDGPVIVNPDDVIVDKNEVLDSETQKEKLEQVAMKLMDVFPAKDFEDILEDTDILMSHCDAYFTDYDYDWSELEEAMEEIGETLYSEDQKGDYKWEYTYTLFLSNCTGVVTLDKDKASYKDSKDTRLIIKDVQGEDWEIKVTPEGLKKVFLGEFLETYYDGEYTDVYNVTVEIPSSLSLEIKKGGKFFASAEVRFDYSISKDGVDVEKDRIGVELDIKVDDLVLTVRNAAYNASTGKLEFSHSLKKGEYFIWSESVAVTADLEYYEDEDGYIYVEDWNGEVDFEMNILGEIQIRGTLNDLERLAGYLEDDYESERDCERGAENATELVDLGVYYDGTSVRQASIEFDPVVYDEGYGYEYYWIEPVIVFEDGSRYLFYEYFDDEIFDDLVAAFEDFIYDYEDMVENIYE